MEEILQEVNRKISLSKEEIQRNTIIVGSVVESFVAKMKDKDPLFGVMFRRVFYGGSFYDGLKIDKPEEFDLDLLLELPKLSQPALTTSNIPGFVHLQIQNLDGWRKQETRPAFKNFPELLDDRQYLNTQKVLAWMEGVVQRALNELPSNGRSRILTNSKGTFEVTVRKGGPAMTLHLSGPGTQIDVDLVACFVFGHDKWPKNGFRANPVSAKSEFFIVPKKPKAPENQPIPRYWRLSFQEQERVLIDHKERLKPVCRLLKKLRDNLDHDCIASYYIKTVFLHLIDQKDNGFWNMSLSHVFMTVLKEYKTCIENKKIPYYWNKNNNLLSGIKAATLDIFNNRLRTVIRDMENRPETIADYLHHDREEEINEEPEPSSSCLIS